MRGNARSLLDLLEADRYRGKGYDLIRLIAASVVVAHHALGTATDPVRADLLYRFSGGYIHFGFLAVAVFFAVSGFLVSPSLKRSTDIVSFGVKRIVRIYPALIAVVLMTALVVGPMLTTLPTSSYFREAGTYIYLKNMVPLTIDLLPGVTSAGRSVVVNGSLWTLYFEVLAYIGLAMMSLSGALRHRWVTLLLFIAFLALDAYAWYTHAPIVFLSDRFMTFANLFVYFLGGVTAYLYADRLPANPIPAAVLFCVAFAALPLGMGPLLIPPCVALLANFVGVVGFPIRWSPTVDISYGIYLTHGPVLAAIVVVMPGAHQWWLIASFTLAVAAVLARISALTIERPALNSKQAIIVFIERRAIDPMRRLLAIALPPRS